MANSDPPVSIPPVRNGLLTITATPKSGQSPTPPNVIVVDAAGKTLRLIVTKGDANKKEDTRFEIPIGEADWSLEIIAV